MSVHKKNNSNSDTTIKDPLSAAHGTAKSETQDWWKNFFHGVALDLWRSAISADQTRMEADFIQKELKLKPGERVLDVPCGNGRLSRELAARGLHATGVDIAQENIDEAKAGSQSLQEHTHWTCRDMRDLPWKAAFDGAFCFGNSFGYLQEDENEDFLTAVARALKPGASFLIEGTCTEALVPQFQERKWYPIGDITFLSASRYDVYRSRIETNYTFIRDGLAETRPASQRIYSCGELCRLAAKCGFSDFHAYCSTQGDPFQLGSLGFLLAMKKGLRD